MSVSAGQSRPASDENKKLQDDISSDLARYRPRRTKRYVFVNVLLLSWKDDDIGCGKEVEDLGRMFLDHFNYSIWPYKIPSKDAQTSLTLCVAQFIKNFGGPENLILVYYGGHGGLASTRSPCTWAA